MTVTDVTFFPPFRSLSRRGLVLVLSSDILVWCCAAGMQRSCALLAFLLVLLPTIIDGFAGNMVMNCCKPTNAPAVERRAVLRAGAALAAGLCVTGPAHAFENRIGDLFPQLNGKPYGASTPVPKGVGTGTSLKSCPSSEEVLARPPPNCFSSTVPKDDKEHFVPPFKFSKSSSEAMSDLVAAAKSYPPGQGNIDGGGSKIAGQSDQYLYLQFESEKIGYLDDLEFLLDPNQSHVLVRSASRVGFLDFGVNAKRVNWFADYLSKKGGWTVERVTTENHPDYFAQNGSE